MALRPEDFHEGSHRGAVTPSHRDPQNKGSAEPPQTLDISTLKATKMVAGEGIEPPTQGFSIPCFHRHSRSNSH